ncbi:MAG: ATP-grasp domain-containing protein [Candidatus Omnitrophica bacterium]|nr:ATP-grasp domain-containing protein [Candidatus Omnitrophota bacterium]
MKVALVYNLKKDPEVEGVPIDYYSEFDSKETIESISNAISSSGHQVCLVEADNQIVDRLISERPDIVFNISEGLNGPSRESQVPAILDYLDIPYTGSGVMAQTISLDKATAKRLFLHHKIPTPKFQVFKGKNEPLKRQLTFPLIVKPNSEGSAKGITKDSVVYNKSRLQREVDKIIRTYNQDALVEEFIDGKEVTIGILGNDKFFDLPILEIDFSNCKDSGEYFYSWRMKEYQGSEELGLTPQFYCPANLEEEVAKRIKEVAYKAHSIIGCKDFSRVDVRLSRDNVPYALEINPLPGLDQKESNFPMIAKAAGISYDKLIETILMLAVSRYKKDKASHYKELVTSSRTDTGAADYLNDSMLKGWKSGI